MKQIAALLALVLGLGLAACGGSFFLTYRFGGTVSGSNCFDGVPQVSDVFFTITLGDFEIGSPVTLVDQFGNTWVGAMTSSSAFRVTNSAANADQRTSIVVNNFSPSGAYVNATTSCVSFRCCTTMSGNVKA
ncbi:MAG TPA: hypothetical protein VF450_11440 [Noviherbaspirillum sp.]